MTPFLKNIEQALKELIATGDKVLVGVSGGADSINSNSLSQKKRLSRNNKKKREMQDKWEEMYKSVEKSKKINSDQNGSPFQTLEQKLQQIKELRSDKMITEAEYQKRKQKLLNSL